VAHAEVARWKEIWGQFWADFGHGPKTKFVVHLMLSEFD
jgi:hypothetical protein